MIAVMALAAYGPTLPLGFLWDDHVIIENNPSLRSWSWETIKGDFKTDNTLGTGDNYYRPLQAMSHRIDYTIWGLRPFGYHLTNVLFHIANAWLVRALVLVLGCSPLAALMTSMLFAVHPIGVEQFIIPSGRGTPISFFFVLLSLLYLIKEGRKAAVMGCVFYTVALFFKEYSLVTPMLYGLLLLYRKEKPHQRWTFAALLLLSFFYLAARHGAVHETIGELPSGHLARFMKHAFAKVLVHYVELILVPWNLHSHRLLFPMSPYWTAYLAAWIVLIMALWIRRSRLGLFAVGWLLINISPTIPQIIKGRFVLDHWGYPLLPAVLIPLSVFFDRQWVRGAQSKLASLCAATFFPLLIAWALLVHVNVALRGTDEKMYTWALHFTTSSPIRYNLAVLYLNTGRPRLAQRYFSEVLCVYPENAQAARGLGLAQTLVAQERQQKRP